MTTPDQRLEKLGLVLPTPAKPVANYVGYNIVGNLLFTSGQLPFHEGNLVQTGLLGDTVSKDEGRLAARQAAINVLAQVKDACGGDLARVNRVVKLGGFIACVPSFTEHPVVMNGASDLMVDVFGDLGRHARTTIGVPSLPLNASVEVEGIFEIA
jgi:enamine deaminase RidA (YjgF/YER057c/UK114 family)